MHDPDSTYTPYFPAISIYERIKLFLRKKLPPWRSSLSFRLANNYFRGFAVMRMVTFTTRVKFSGVSLTDPAAES